MGQGESTEARTATPEQLSQELTLKFAENCYTQLELYCFKQAFRSLADTESDMRFWTESSLVRFLELPDVLGAGPIVFQMSSFLGAFPFASQAPAILTIEALLRVITLMTKRFKRVLKRGEQDRYRLFYSSLAVFDRKASQDIAAQLEADNEHDRDREVGLLDRSDPTKFEHAYTEHEDEEDEEDDRMTLDALESLDAIEAIGFSEQPSIHHSIIPTDNLVRLIELLLFVAPLHAQESLSQHSDKLTPENVKKFREVAKCIISGFCVEAEYGISYRTFMPVVESSLPFMFEGFGALFEHFLFEKDFDLSRRKSTSSEAPASPPLSPSLSKSAKPQPILEESGEILTQISLTQISCFINPSTLFGRMHHLYSGMTHGFSLGAFESAVFNWQAPTLLLVSGTLLGPEPNNSQERAFFDSLPPRRFPSSIDTSSEVQSEETVQGQVVTYGVYVPQQWQQTHKHAFGNASTILFQLSPVHDVFRASEIVQDYVTFSTTPTSAHPGINFGSPLDQASSAKATSSGHSHHHVPLGPVSLFIDSSLEFAVFTHTAAGGGTFYPSASPLRNGTARYRQRKRASTNPSVTSPTTLKRRMTLNSIASAKPGDHQNRFSITSLEVWGIGGDAESRQKIQKEKIVERERKMRRESIVGGVDADREILRMAGMIGQYGARGEG